MTASCCWEPISKDPAALQRAYDDSAGVTAEFNLNVRRVINRELSANFDVAAFERLALYDEERGWVEMRLPVTADRLDQFRSDWETTCQLRLTFGRRLPKT